MRGDGGLDRELSGDVEHSAADSDGDLGADYLGDGTVFLAVMVHETDSHEVDEGAEGDVWFVEFCVFYEEGNEDGGDGGREGKYLGYVASGGNGEVLDDEEVGVEVGLDGEEECHWE